MSRNMGWSRLIMLISLSLCLIPLLSACQTIKLSDKAGAGSTSTASSGQGGGAAQTSTDVSGPWQISYEVNQEPRSAHLNLVQTGNTFEGTGTDDHDGQNFVVSKGVITGNHISFHKRYHVDENPNLPPIIYQGSFEMAKTETYSGPYMSGTYNLAKAGTNIGGKWDGQKEGAATSSAQAPVENPPPQPVNTGKAPHLSGKWDAGYEFEFKTVHSSIYLEQDGPKLVGHGIDKNSKETFSLQGNYKFPDIRFVLKYNAVKGPKGKSKPERKLEFRGTVSVVNEAEYQGPRLEGKTNGGGAWMAEIVK